MSTSRAARAAAAEAAPADGEDKPLFERAGTAFDAAGNESKPCPAAKLGQAVPTEAH